MTLITKDVKKEIVEEEYQGFLCHKCNQIFSDVDIVESQESFHHTFTGGYGSKFGDGATGEITLCNSCFYEVLNPYVKYVEKDGMDKYGEEDFTCEDFENCPAKWCTKEYAGCSDLDRKNYEGYKDSVEPEDERVDFDAAWKSAHLWEKYQKKRRKKEKDYMLRNSETEEDRVVNMGALIEHFSCSICNKAVQEKLEKHKEKKETDK